MKQVFILSIIFFSFAFSSYAQKANDSQNSQTGFYIDVHHLSPGKVSFEDVAAAHAKDLATQDKYKVHFIKY